MGHLYHGKLLVITRGYSSYSYYSSRYTISKWAIFHGKLLKNQRVKLITWPVQQWGQAQENIRSPRSPTRLGKWVQEMAGRLDHVEPSSISGWWWLEHGYGSIPINTIISGMNIHKSQLFWGSLGTRVLTHPHMNFMTFHILGRIIPTDFHIFQRGWNRQPDLEEEYLKQHLEVQLNWH